MQVGANMSTLINNEHFNKVTAQWFLIFPLTTIFAASSSLCLPFVFIQFNLKGMVGEFFYGVALLSFSSKTLRLRSKIPSW